MKSEQNIFLNRNISLRVVFQHKFSKVHKFSNKVILNNIADKSSAVQYMNMYFAFAQHAIQINLFVL